MAQAARTATALTIAPRFTKPTMFAGTDAAWRSLCDCYPTAETSDVLMALMEYCAVRRLDPYKKPVHVVPMYNSKLRRKVQVIMSGINEIETTAMRTGAWAGMDLPEFGPLITKTFEGTRENDQGGQDQVKVTVSFPEWCAVKVYRMVEGQPRSFAEQLWWLELYARAGFRTEVPNARWQQAPRQMLHKCTKAAVLRAAFPEEGLGYAAEEMEGKETDGGITIDGTAEPSLPSKPTDPLETLNDTTNGSAWLKRLLVLITETESVDQLHAIAQHPKVKQALEKSATLVQAQIRDALKAAYERVDPADLLADLLAQLDEMHLEQLEALSNNSAFQQQRNELFPPDQDLLEQHVAERIRELKEQPA